MNRCKHFIARIDMVDGDDYKGIFLKRIANKNETTFAKDDVVVKLSTPLSTGSSSRTRCQLCCKENLPQWDISSAKPNLQHKLMLFVCWFTLFPKNIVLKSSFFSNNPSNSFLSCFECMPYCCVLLMLILRRTMQ